MQPGRVKEFFRQFLLLTAGASLAAIGVYFFKIPNNFSTGGISGLSIILSRLIVDVFHVEVAWLSAGALLTYLNVLLILLALIIVGRDFSIKTVYCTLLMSGLTWLLEQIVPLDKPLTTQPLLELIFAIGIPSIGTAILFYEGASTGGTDIIAMIIKKYSTINISISLFIADSFIVLSSIFVFKNAETFLFCALGLVSKTFFVNRLLEGINTSKSCIVITSKDYEDLICEFITKELRKSATISEAFSSAYLHENKTVIITVLTRSQALRLKRYTKQVDEHSFIVVNSTSTIYGNGFRETL